VIDDGSRLGERELERAVSRQQVGPVGVAVAGPLTPQELRRIGFPRQQKTATVASPFSFLARQEFVWVIVEVNRPESRMDIGFQGFSSWKSTSVPCARNSRCSGARFR